MVGGAFGFLATFAKTIVINGPNAWGTALSQTPVHPWDGEDGNRTGGN
jgi:hypothetical protein